MKREGVDLDSVLQEIGHCGRYQRQTYYYILLVIIFSAIYNCQYVFNVAAVKYRCQVPECESSPMQFEPKEWGDWALPASGRDCHRLVPVGTSCTADSFLANKTQPCTSWVYESNDSIVAEFNLACQEWKRTLVGSVHSAGVLSALPITAIVSDTFGRRLALVVTSVAPAFVGIARSFCNGYITYVVLEYIEATVNAGVYSTAFILALEMVGLNKRVIGGNIISSTFAVGQTIAALIAWVIPYWRTYTLIIYIPSVLFLSYIWLVEESVRWLLSKGRNAEAARIIFKAAAINGKQLCPETVRKLKERSSLDLSSTAAPETPHLEQQLEKSVFMQVIHSRTMLFRMVVCSFWWNSVTLIYYGLSLNSVALAGNRYINYILTSLVEIPGYCLSMLTLDRFGRKSSIMTSFLICGVSLCVLPFATKHNMVVILLSMVGKLCISMIFCSIYIYTIELFPTQVRHSLMAVCSMIGRIGSMVAPQTPLLMVYMESLPYLLFGVTAGIAGALMLFTPETLHIKLPDTVEQAANIDTAPRTRQRTDIIVD